MQDILKQILNPERRSDDYDLPSRPSPLRLPPLQQMNPVYRFGDDDAPASNAPRLNLRDAMGPQQAVPSTPDFADDIQIAPRQQTEQEKYDAVTRALGGVPRGQRSSRPMDLAQAITAASMKARMPEKSMFDVQNQVVDEYNQKAAFAHKINQPEGDNQMMQDLRARGFSGDQRAMDKLMYLIKNPDEAAGILGGLPRYITPSRGQMALREQEAEIQRQNRREAREDKKLDFDVDIRNRELTSKEKAEAARLGLSEQEMKNRLELGKGDQALRQKELDQQQDQFNKKHELDKTDPGRIKQQRLNELFNALVTRGADAEDPETRALAEELLRKEQGLPSIDQARVTKATADKIERENNPGYIGPDKINSAAAAAQQALDANPLMSEEEALMRASKQTGVPVDKIAVPQRYSSAANDKAALTAAGFADEKDAYRKALEYAAKMNKDLAKQYAGGLGFGVLQNKDESYRNVFGPPVGNNPDFKRVLRNEVMQYMRDKNIPDALAAKIASQYQKMDLVD